VKEGKSFWKDNRTNGLKHSKKGKGSHKGINELKDYATEDRFKILGRKITFLWGRRGTMLSDVGVEGVNAYLLRGKG